MPIENNIESFNNTKNLEISNYLDMLNTVLSYASHPEHAALGLYTMNKGLETLKLYLDAGASPDVVLDAAIRHMHLPSVKLALQYKHKITKSHLKTALKTDNIDIIVFVLLNQPAFDLTKKEVEYCLTLKIKIYELFTAPLECPTQTTSQASDIKTSRFNLLTNKNKRMLIKCCIRYYRGESSYFTESLHPLITQYIHETPLKRKNFRGLLKTAIIHKCSDIISLLLRKGALLSNTHSYFFLLVSIEEALAFSNEIKQLLNSGEKLSKKCRKNLDANLNVLLDYALEKSINATRPVEELESLVRQGACLTTLALCWFKGRLYDAIRADFIPKALTRNNQVILSEYHISDFIVLRLNIFDLFSSILKNYQITELIKFVHQCFKVCLEIDTSIPVQADYAQTQLTPFMFDCFKHGVDINESFFNSPWHTPLLQRREHPTVYRDFGHDYTPNSLTFLQAAMLTRKHYLVKCLIENGAVLGKNIIELNCRPSVTGIVQPGLTRSIFELTDRKTQATYLETVASLRILHRFRVALFIIFNGVSQKESFFNQSKISPSIILTVLECMWPNKVERETYLAQYKRIMKDNKHFLFKELKPETLSQPIEPHVRLPKKPIKK